MSARRATSRGWSWRAIAAVLALAGFVLTLAVPPGYMLSAANGAGPELVICTGHGPIDLSAKAPADHGPEKTANDLVCAFAGHLAGALTAPSAPSLGLAFAVVQTDVPVASRDVVPGRGLAAPPPPSHAPPSIV